MKLIIENWSSPTLYLPRLRIQQQCESRGYDFFEVNGSNVSECEYFTELVGSVARLELPLYVVKSRPADVGSIDEFRQWLEANGFDGHEYPSRAHRSPDFIGVHCDHYGDKLKPLAYGTLKEPLRPDEIVEFRTIEQVRSSIESVRQRKPEVL